MARVKQTAVRAHTHRSSSKSSRAAKDDKPDGGVKKKRRKLPGTKALAEIRKEQRSTEELLRRAPFKRIVDDLLSGQPWRMCPRDETVTVDEAGVEHRTPCSFSYSGTGVNVADQDSKVWVKGVLPEGAEAGAEAPMKRCRSLDGSGALVPAASQGVRWSHDAVNALSIGCGEMLVDVFRDANALMLSSYSESRAPVTLNPEHVDAAFTMRHNPRYVKMTTDKGYFGSAHVRQKRDAARQARKLEERRAVRKQKKEDVGELARELKRKEAEELEAAEAKAAAKKAKKTKAKAKAAAGKQKEAAAVPKVPKPAVAVEAVVVEKTPAKTKAAPEKVHAPVKQPQALLGSDTDSDSE
jgi:histone H3/H4